MRERIIAMLVAGTLPLAWLQADAAAVERTRVFGCGGDRVTTTAYDHSFTVGQVAIGVMANQAYIHSVGFWYATFQFTTDVPDAPVLPPDKFLFGCGGSNPLGPVGLITYAVPVPSSVTIRLYDAAGRLMKTLVDADTAPGYYQAWLSSAGLNSGIYFCRMEAAGFSSTRKLVLLR